MMEMVIEVFITLLITYENGFKANGKVKHKVNRLPFMREDATREEILFAVDVMRPVMVGKIVSVDLETKKIKRLLTPEMRREKLEKEGEEFEASSVQRTAVASNAGVSQSAVSTASGTTTATVGVQSAAAPVSTGASVQAAAVVATNDRTVPLLAVIPVSFRDPVLDGVDLCSGRAGSRSNSHPTDGETRRFTRLETRRFSAYGSRKTTGMTTEGGESGLRNIDPLQKSGFAAPVKTMTDRFKLRLEDLFKSPLAETTAYIGAPPRLEKIDVPQIYKDGP